MSFFKDKYNTVSEFFKDIRRAIDSLTIRVNDLDTRRDELGVAKPVIDEDTNYTADELSVAVDSGTASISLSNGTDPLKVIGDGVLLSVDDNSGALKLSAGDSSVALGITVSGSGVASLALDNDTEPVKIVGGEGVTLSLNGSGMLQIDVEGSTAPTGATGISSSISGNSAIIELTGGSGSVQINGSSNVNITGSNGVINIDVPASTVTPPPTPGSGQMVRNIFGSSTGVFLLEKDSENYIYYPQPYYNGSEWYIYNFEQISDTEKPDVYGRNSCISAIEAVIGKSVVDTENGFIDDKGDMILILPLNPPNLCSVRVYVAPECARAVVVSVEGKRIIAHDGGRQGVDPYYGHYTDWIAYSGSYGHDYLYVFVSSTTGWPASYHTGYNYETVIAQCGSSGHGGCWVRISLD